MTSTRTMLQRWLPLAALAVAAVALVACGGDDADGTPAGRADGGTATATSEGQGDAFRARSPNDLDSYRYRVDVTVDAAALDSADAGLPIEGDLSFNVEGAVVNPDREQTATSIDLGLLTLTTETIRVGADEWTRAGQGAWSTSTPSNSAGGDLLAVDISPAALFAASGNFDYHALTQRLDEHEWQEEQVNGVSARRYTFTEQQFYEVFQTEDAILPADIDATFVADIWFAQDRGVPVRLIISGTDGAGDEILRLEMNLTDMDTDIAIAPPA